VWTATPVESERRVAIDTLVRRRDDVVVGLHDLDHPAVHATVSGRSGASQFAVLAHWAGSATPLRCVTGGIGALLVDGSGSAVRLRRTAAADSLGGR
jgi:hypothetical protein